MTNPEPGNLYERQYLEASAVFKDDPLKCIQMAKYNLTDQSLPAYYVMENCMLIACALDDWNEADIWRRAAEERYNITIMEATRRNDENSLEMLRRVRIELDELNEFRMEELTGLSREEREAIPEDPVSNEADEVEQVEYDMENADDVGFEDASAVAQAENADEVAADSLLLPIRSADASPATPIPTLNIIEPAEGSNNAAPEVPAKRLKHKKSERFSTKGGAFWAQHRNRSDDKPTDGRK